MQNSLTDLTEMGKKRRKSLIFIFFARSTFPESAPTKHPLTLEMKIKELKLSLIVSSCLFCNVNISRCLPVILSVFYCRLSLCSQGLIHPGQVSNTDKRPSTDATQQVLGIQPTSFCALELPLKNILQGELYCFLLKFKYKISLELAAKTAALSILRMSCPRQSCKRLVNIMQTQHFVI